MSSIDEIAKLKIEPIDDLQIENEDMEDGIRDIKIITYNDMANFECLDCLFDKHNYIMMLYQTDSPTSGHWVSLIRDKKSNTVYYFDSYGYDIDIPQGWSTNSMVKGLLSNLFENDKQYKKFVNKKKYQKLGNHINTCGRHSINWIQFHKNTNGTLYDYYNFMKTLKKDLKQDYDDIVCILVNDD
jgi:hypothetical protein